MNFAKKIAILLEIIFKMFLFGSHIININVLRDDNSRKCRRTKIESVAVQFLYLLYCLTDHNYESSKHYVADLF